MTTDPETVKNPPMGPCHPLGEAAAPLRQALLEATTNSAFLIDADGFILAANEIGAARLGAPPEEIVGRNAREFIPWEVFRRRMMKLHDAICTRKPVRFEDERNGIWFDNRFSPLFDPDGEVVCVAVYAEVITGFKDTRASLHLAYRDMEQRVRERTRELQEANESLKNEIRQRTEAEAALRESETRFRQLTDHIADVFWLTDLQAPMRVLYASPAFETIWGYSRRDLYQDPDLWLKSVHQDDREGLVRAFDAFIREGTEFRAEFRIIRPDGSVRWIFDRGVPILDEEGRPKRLAGVAQDITARKRVERHREDLVEELQQFSYVISHDLRAPLINLKGFSGEVRMALDTLFPLLRKCSQTLSRTDRQVLNLAINEDLPEALGFIESSATRMEGMINAILKLARAGRRQTSPEPLDMAGLVAGVLDSLAFQIQKAGAEVRVGNLPDTPADRMDMEQIFANLIGNAVQYLDPSRPGLIEIDGRLLFDEIRFEVRDNGMGVPPDQRERIFELFHRVDERNIPGDGLGLAYVRTVIRRQGGRIWCEPAPGPGTAFCFTLPVAPAPPERGGIDGPP
jgi:PAS domain S-box-containing protein